MKDVPSFDIELSQAMDYIMASPLAQKAFFNPPFPQYTNILRLLIQAVDRLADNCHMPEFTNHALPHVCSIVRRASEWALEDGWLDELSEQEAGYLLLALVIHDIGMLSQDAQDLPDKDKNQNMKGFADIANWVRRTHVIRLQGLVLRLLQEELKQDLEIHSRASDSEKGRIVLKDHILVVIGMAASHQCWEWDSQFVSNKDSIKKLSLNESRIAALNSVIAVCDLLDEDSNRCDTITLIKYRHGSMENLAHWIRHALTVEVDGVRKHKVTVTFRILNPSIERYEKIYRALRNHYRLVKLYNHRLENINAKIEHLVFNPPDGIPERVDGISNELSNIWTHLPEFKDHIVEQILSTFMPEALNKDGGDVRLRHRLDELGLETINLTAESLFLDPPTIYFPDEKILLKKGNFKEQLKYIKEQVDTAYLDGNIGKICHLCLTALKCWDTEVSLNDIYWVFTYVVVFQKYGNEIDYVAYHYHNSLMQIDRGRCFENLVMEGEYQPLLDVLLLLQEPRIGEKWYNKYVMHIKTYTYNNLEDDIATQLLLETVVGLLWYFNQEGTAWLEVAEYLKNQLPDSLKMKFSAYVERIEIQHIIINRSNDKNGKKNCQNWIHPMEKAWIFFWDDDWQNQDQIIPELCRMGNYDRDYVEPVQGYLDLVRWNIHCQQEMIDRDRKSTEKKQERLEIRDRQEMAKNLDTFGNKDIEVRQDDVENRIEKSGNFRGMDAETYMEIFQNREIDVGRYRYNRIILEQPLPIFWEQRKLLINSIIGECRRKKYNSQSQRKNIIRLMALHTLDALRYWDLWQYIEMIRSQTMLEFLNGTYVDKYGTYCGDKSALRNCFIDYIKGLDSERLCKEEQQLAAMLLVKYAHEELDEIIQFIVEQSIPLQWMFALHVVEMFAPDFSIKQRKCLLPWLVRYNEFYKKQKKYFSSSQYQFLQFWCKEMDEKDWVKIEDILDDIFKYQTNMMVNSKLVEAVFEYAPWKYCLKYINRMKGFPNNNKKSYDLYSTIITMSQRKDIKSTILINHLGTLGQEMQVEQTKLKSLQEIVDWFLEDINQQIDDFTASKDGEEVSEFDLKRMKSRYEELKRLITVDRLEQLEAVDLTMINQSLKQMEEAIEKRGDLRGYDSTFMTPVEDVFINKNWNVEDKNEGKRIVDRIFSTMEKYKESMSIYFFVDFCRLLHLIEGTCGVDICEYINHTIIEKMVCENFFYTEEQSKNKEKNWDGPYKLFRFDDGSNNQYEVMVTLLLINGMIAFKQEERLVAIKYMTKALCVNEPIIYNYATVLFSYFFLMDKQLCENSADAEVLKSMAWGGLQFILGHLSADNQWANSVCSDEIKNWVQKALNAMVESEIWFGKEGFLIYANKDSEYMEWIVASGCELSVD